MSETAFQHSPNHESSADSESGSFVTGFTVGLFAGAIGYYLFGTKDGRSLVKDIQGEWQEAQEFVASQVAEVQKSSVGHQAATTAKGWWSSLKAELRRVAEAEHTNISQVRKKNTASKSKSKTKHTFSGV